MREKRSKREDYQIVGRLVAEASVGMYLGNAPARFSSKLRRFKIDSAKERHRFQLSVNTPTLFEQVGDVLPFPGNRQAGKSVRHETSGAAIMAFGYGFWCLHQTAVVEVPCLGWVF